MPEKELHFNGEGVIEILLDTPQNAEKLIIQAYYEDENDRESSAKTELTVLAQYGQKDRFLQISTSTKRAQAGEYAVFHVRTNFYLKSFDY
ncbi:hypothetical protein X975_21595, partial [Stegodyphus mimosarum]